MKKTIEIIVGANNDTGIVELDKIEQIISDRHEGFTVYPVTGYWQGKKESSVIVIIHDDMKAIKNTINQLKYELAQDAIAYHQARKLKFA